MSAQEIRGLAEKFERTVSGETDASTSPRRSSSCGSAFGPGSPRALSSLWEAGSWHSPPSGSCSTYIVAVPLAARPENKMS